MAVSNLQVLDIIEVMEAFLERHRPPQHIRPKAGYGLQDRGTKYYHPRDPSPLERRFKDYLSGSCQDNFCKSEKSLEGLLASGKFEMVRV